MPLTEGWPDGKRRKGLKDTELGQKGKKEGAMALHRGQVRRDRIKGNHVKGIGRPEGARRGGRQRNKCRRENNDSANLRLSIDTEGTGRV